MFRGRAHVLHNEFRMAKHTCIEALKNKMPFFPRIECHEEGVVNIAAPEGLNSYYNAGCCEPARNSNKIIRGFVIHNISMTSTNSDLF
jgi:hypothetical protein